MFSKLQLPVCLANGFVYVTTPLGNFENDIDVRPLTGMFRALSAKTGEILFE